MRFVNNGHTIYLHTDLEMGAVRPSTRDEYYEQITISGEKYWYPRDTDWYKFVAKTFDYAVPQSFFDDYMREHGRRPYGVWCYDKELGCSPIFGDFLSRHEAIVIAIDKILELWDKRIS